jgi:hypothetical protein
MCPLNGFLALSFAHPLKVDRNKFVYPVTGQVEEPHFCILRQNDPRHPFDLLKKFFVIVPVSTGIFQSCNFSSNRYRLTTLLTSSTPMWNASSASLVEGSLPETIDDASKPFFFLHWYKNFETSHVSFPAYNQIFGVPLTSSGRYRSNVAILLGNDGSCQPSVGSQMRDRGSAKSISPPCR